LRRHAGRADVTPVAEEARDVDMSGGEQDHHPGPGVPRGAGALSRAASPAVSLVLDTLSEFGDLDGVHVAFLAGGRVDILLHQLPAARVRSLLDRLGLDPASGRPGPVGAEVGRWLAFTGQGSAPDDVSVIWFRADPTAGLTEVLGHVAL
jgi:hypothetical protein